MHVCPHHHHAIILKHGIDTDKTVDEQILRSGKSTPFSLLLAIIKLCVLCVCVCARINKLLGWMDGIFAISILITAPSAMVR